jgi:hypothetical protein
MKAYGPDLAGFSRFQSEGTITTRIQPLDIINVLPPEIHGIIVLGDESFCAYYLPIFMLSILQKPI